MQVGSLRTPTSACSHSIKLRPATSQPSRMATRALATKASSIVICGGGIMGTATAHYLAELNMGPAITLVEQEDVACAASGKAGGFLAETWHDGKAARDLAAASYALHARLAEQFGADAIGYRPVTTLTVVGSESPLSSTRKLSAASKKLLPAWVDGHVSNAHLMGTPADTAQVHPERLTKALMVSAQSRGARLLKGKVTGLKLDQDKQVTGVCVNDPTGKETVVPADVAVIALGPWSGAAVSWGLQLPRVSGQKYHSIVLKPQKDTGSPQAGPEMLFTHYTLGNGRAIEPEVYPRPDGTVYVCGEPQSVSLPDNPGDVVVEEGLGDKLRAVGASLTSHLQDAEVVARQACYLPVGPDNLPIIGAVPGAQGVFVATGHTCWGILNGPATGKALAELIVNGKSDTLDLQPFSPARFLSRKIPTF